MLATTLNQVSWHKVLRRWRGTGSVGVSEREKYGEGLIAVPATLREPHLSHTYRRDRPFALRDTSLARTRLRSDAETSLRLSTDIVLDILEAGRETYRPSKQLTEPPLPAHRGLVSMEAALGIPPTIMLKKIAEQGEHDRCLF